MSTVPTQLSVDNYLIAETTSIRDALRAINALSGHGMTLMVVDNCARLTGTLTDGDIRRALIAGVVLDSPISEVMNRQFAVIHAGDDPNRLLAEFRSRGIRIVPVIDRAGHVIRVIDVNSVSSILPLRAVIMAGGRGERLRPLTDETPKPLLEVGGRAIIDHNVALLAKYGISEVTVTTRYLAHLIEEHFARPLEGMNIKCVHEEHPLGTIGAVKFADIPEEGYTLVMNSDLLTTIPLNEMWLQHRNMDAAITVAAVPYSVSVPYAILTTDNDELVTGIEEKPTFTRHANAGIYIIANRLLRNIPDGVKYDATDLIEAAIRSGERVAYYPINGVWIDIGSHDDYRKARELMKVHSQLS